MRMELEQAAAEAARHLQASGLEARAVGTLLHCAFPDGGEVVLRSRLAPGAAFDREALLNNLASALLAAESGFDDAGGARG
jgi:hypothetical protein